MTRGGREDENEGPERRCIVTGEVAPKDGLIRFVIGPDNQVVADILGKLPGRGIYVTADRAAIDKAVSKGLFARAARQPVVAAADLSAHVEAQITRRVVGLARKAGSAVTGYEKVKDWLAKGQARVLIQASDGSERGKTKISLPEGENRFIGCLTAGELGLSFGREHAIHAALGAGGLTNRVVEEAARLAGLRGHVGGRTAGRDKKDA
jgi:predicted RNA-binding protein YlxR (DUF448 family)